MEWFRSRVSYHVGPGLSDIKAYEIPEGRSTAFVRENGDFEENPMQQISADFEIMTSDVPHADFPFIKSKLEDSAKSMGEQQARMFFDTLEKATTKTGNVVKARGRMTVDDFFQSLELIEISFDELGRPEMPRMVVGQGAFDQLKEIDKEIRESAVLRSQFDEIMTKKKRKWLAGEAARKLVG